jgi:hypothetical protein
MRVLALSLEVRILAPMAPRAVTWLTFAALDAMLCDRDKASAARKRGRHVRA